MYVAIRDLENHHVGCVLSASISFELVEETWRTDFTKNMSMYHPCPSDNLSNLLHSFQDALKR